jgi:hypothetical protein
MFAFQCREVRAALRILAVVPLVVLSACVAPSKRVAMTEPEQEIAFESNPALARFWGDEATLSYAV